MYSFKLAFKNIASRKSSLVIIFFIAFAIALLFVSNAIFDGTDSGVKSTFIKSFTGDIVIRPKVDFPLSLFGDETPSTGKFSEIPTLTPYIDVSDYVESLGVIGDCLPQLSGRAAIHIKGEKIVTLFFGVQSDSYLKMMSSIKVVEGKPFSSDEKGLMLNRATVENIKEETGCEVHVGDNIQIISSSGIAYSVRSLKLTGIFDYGVKNQTLNQIALISPDVLRDMMGITDFSEDNASIDSSHTDLISGDGSIDDLFSDSGDFTSEEADDNVKELLDSAPSSEEASQISLESTAWSFIVCSLKPGVKEKKVLADMNRHFKEKGWPVQAVNWRTAAGGTVYLIFYIRIIFNIGVILVLATGFIVVNNTLVISSLSRVCETGTMRALGAGRTFVIRQYFFETAILTVSAGIVGCLLGLGMNEIVSGLHIHISNDYLAQMFGGETLVTVITLGNLGKCFGLSLVLAVIGCMYPIHVALDSSPVEAMRGQM